MQFHEESVEIFTPGLDIEIILQMDSCQICTQSVPPFYPSPLYANFSKLYSFHFLQKHACNSKKTFLGGSVVDPDPTDPYVFGLPDQDPSLFCTDPDPGPSINKQNK